MMFSASGVDTNQPLSFAPRTREPLDVLRAAFDSAPRGIVVCQEDGAIRFANVQASTIFDYPPGELIGQPLSRLLPDAVDGLPNDQWSEFWKNPTAATMAAARIVDGLRRDGERLPLEIRLRNFTDGTMRLVIVWIVDPSERATVEARLAAATQTNLEFQRLIADAATRFGAVSPDGVDDAIAESLSQIGESMQLDWAVLWRWRSGDAHATTAHHWMRPSHLSPSEPFPMAKIPFVAGRLEAEECCAFATLDDLPESDREAFRRHGLRSVVAVPLPPTRDGDHRALALGSVTREQVCTPIIIERLRLIAGVVGQALARQASHNALVKALDEVRRLKDRVVVENGELRREVKVLRTTRPIVSESPAIRRVLDQVEQVAPTPATVLLLGETGTGKEVMAQAVHDLSPRHQRPMIRVSCAAIPTALIESELFGRERGAYTGALSRQIGRFEAANQSTLFLDEIGDLPMEVQVKLLRVLQERVIERLGSTQSVKVDVRIIAATNRNLEQAVCDKLFREDLFYRLNVFPVVVPPLRERVEDIGALVWSFIDEFSSAFGKTIESISKDSMRALERYSWPGNVRELRNVIERAVIVATGRQLVVAAPRLGERPMPQTAMTLTQLEVEHIRAVLKSTNWRVRGSGGAAERLGIKPTTLESRMARLGIARREAS